MKKLISSALCIMVAFAMTPCMAFAFEEDVAEDDTVVVENDVTVDADAPSDAAEEETSSDEDADSTESTEAADAAEEPSDDSFEVKSEDVVSAGTNTGALLEDVSGYNSTMRIYSIYMHRANGSRVSSDRYGDAVLIKSNGKFILMDTGSITPIKNKESTVIRSSLVKTLKDIGVEELDVYISHLHQDHTGGLEDVCNNFTVNRLYLPDLKLCENYYTPSGYSIESRYAHNINIAKGKVKEIVFLKPSFREHKDIVYNGVEYAPDARVTDKFSVGGATFSVIGPVGSYTVDQFKSQDGECGTKEGHCLNNCSLVTIVQCGKFRFMTAGDIEKQEEAKLVSKYGSSLNCDMMKASHHGLRTSTTSSFVNAVSPMWSFTQDHGFTSGTAAQAKRMKNNGYNYSILDRKCSLAVDIYYNKVRLFPDTNNNGKIDEGPITGWVKVTGSQTRYQYYNPAGFIRTKWCWMNNALYCFSENSGFGFIGKAVMKGSNVEFDKQGKLISHKAPKKTTLKSVKALKKKKIKVSWTKTKGASAYQVFRKAGKNGKYALVGTYSSNARSITNKSGITRGTTYYYKVRAVKYVGGGTMYGAFSKASKAKAR